MDSSMSCFVIGWRFLGSVSSRLRSDWRLESSRRLWNAKRRKGEDACGVPLRIIMLKCPLPRDKLHLIIKRRWSSYPRSGRSELREVKIWRILRDKDIQLDLCWVAMSLLSNFLYSGPPAFDSFHYFKISAPIETPSNITFTDVNHYS